jgi:hypothetical protein
LAHNDRKLASLVSRALQKSAGFEHFLASTPTERNAVFRLRYDAYHAQGLIRARAKASLSDWQDFESSTAIYGITLHGTLVSTIRLSLISKSQKACATYSMFQDCLDPLLDGGRTILDGSRLAVSCGDSAARRCVAMYTLSLAASISVSVGADLGTIIARHSHVPFYERYGFDLVRGPFSYHEALTPLSLMMIDLARPAGNLPADPPHAMPCPTRRPDIGGTPLYA